MAARSTTQGTANAIRPNGRTILIISASSFEDAELIYPYYRLQAEGYAVLVATPKGEVIKGKHGYPMAADLALEKATLKGIDAIVLPGGQSPDALRRDDTATKLVAGAIKAGIPVAAICHGPLLLCSIPKDLRGERTVTSWISIKDDLLNAGYSWVDEAVVLDDGVITSRNPRDLPAFCETLIAVLEGEFEASAPSAASQKLASKKTAAKKTASKTTKRSAVAT